MFTFRYSINSKNKLGEHNEEYTTERSQLEDSLSTKFAFRDDSILGKTQQILNTLPTNGAEMRSHVANVIDQTSRVFQDGDTRISRGSAVKYTDKFTGEESGVEYARVWTKDRPFMTNFDTMPLATNQKDINTKKILVGDLNIAPLENDVWSHKQLLNVVSHTPLETSSLIEMINSGEWVDVMRELVPQDKKLYSWWSYRNRQRRRRV